jgi:hypothetical protein
MKRMINKTRVLTAILLSSGMVAVAQEETNVRANNYLELSYGPQTEFNYQKLTITNADQDEFNFHDFNSSGTFGLRYDHLLTPGFSIGMDFYYVNKNTTGTVRDYTTGLTSDAEFIINRFRTQVRLAYHFPISNPDFDVYLGGGIGMNAQSRKLFINGLEASREEQPNMLSLPVSLRTYAGIRYSFSKHFGANAEIGIGGPIFNAGVHYRF